FEASRFRRLSPLQALEDQSQTWEIRCHSCTNPFNDRLGLISHPGISTTLGNPGTLLIPVGIRVFPLQGYEINAWYMYRAMLDTTLLEAAFAPELAARRISGIRKGEYQEIGGSVLWTRNPNFDIRLAGT